ncbi:hypothetical protein FPANT_8710 [Fusarium pseudoanthophilum]|uniref:Secreted protein n=1 Tax=Fusarium pseudoanthophilum TaxID=48495 RepID=A0A8H5L0N4_9HYPO|nr:hypothetical protein FPANT_8710 [Fusarium pseudoanthophilum]
MTVEVAGTKGTGGTTGAALLLLLLFATNQTAKAAETIPATAADLPSETLVGDGASSVDVLVDAVSGAVDTGLLLVEKVSDAVRIGRLKMITSAPKHTETTVHGSL